MTAPQNWYDFLGLPSDAAEGTIAAEVERRSRQAAALATTAPERSQLLRDKLRAVKQDLLSGATARRLYDARLTAAPPPPQVTPDPSTDSGEPAPMWQQPPQVSAAKVTPVPEARPPFALDEHGRPLPPATAYFGTPTPSSSTPRVGERFRAFVRSAYVCRRCGTAHEPADRWCVACGERLKSGGYRLAAPIAHPYACPYCWTVAQAEHHFCRNCGAARPVE